MSEERLPYLMYSEIETGSDRIRFIHIEERIKINGEETFAGKMAIGDEVEVCSVIYKGTENEKSSFYKFIVRYIQPTRQSFGTCFHGDCTVMTLSELKKAGDIRPGDFVKSRLGGFVEVLAVLATHVGTSIEMYRKGGLLITDNHPVSKNGVWVFPKNCPDFEPLTVFADFIYSFLVDDPSFEIDGTTVIGLAHGITDGDVAPHTYFGTDAVKRDIFSLAPDGYCVITPEQIVRDEATRYVVGIRALSK